MTALKINDKLLDTLAMHDYKLACVNTNRNFIGIELDENYFHIARQRIEAIIYEDKVWGKE